MGTATFLLSNKRLVENSYRKSSKVHHLHCLLRVPALWSALDGDIILLLDSAQHYGASLPPPQHKLQCMHSIRRHLCFRKKDHHHPHHTVQATIVCPISTTITATATTITTTTTTAQVAMHAFRICAITLRKRPPPPPSHSASYDIASKSYCI